PGRLRGRLPMDRITELLFLKKLPRFRRGYSAILAEILADNKQESSSVIRPFRVAVTVASRWRLLGPYCLQAPHLPPVMPCLPVHGPPSPRERVRSPGPTSLPVAEAGCCSAHPSDDNLHRRLMDLLQRYNVNDYAASVRVFAVPANGCYCNSPTGLYSASP